MDLEPPAPGPSPFAARRDRLAELLGPRGAILLASPPERLRNGDSHYKFRQDSDILYLTGFEEPETVLVLRPGHPETPFVLFVRPRHPAEEVWTGRRAGIEGAVKRFGADAAFPTGELDRKLPELLSGVEDLHYPFGRDPDLDERILAVVARLRAGERRGLRAPLRLVDPRASIHELRLVKSEDELALLRRAAAITAEAHVEAMRAARPGGYEHEVEAVVDFTFRRLGGRGPGYPTIVGGGRNATILHYVENSARIEEGTLLLVDAGCEVEGFTADVTRTFPARGRFSPPQRRLYQAVLDAQAEAIAAVRPGATIDGIHAGVVDALTRRMVDLGLLRGDAPALVKDQAYRAYYMHRTSHWLGLDVHDAGSYSLAGAPRPLVPGMVLTVEPGLYVAEDAADAPAEYRGVGVRIEDDVLVTSGGCEVLTRAAPKSVEEIEALTAR